MYSITETLTRTLAWERMKYLADEYAEARAAQDGGRMRLIQQERQQLQRQYMKVVK